MKNVRLESDKYPNFKERKNNKSMIFKWNTYVKRMASTAAS